MQFRDGQLLTAEDINKYLVNREGSLDTSIQTAKNQEYATSLTNLQQRIDETKGKVINFPGYSTNIIQVDSVYYQSPANAGNNTGTPGWQSVQNEITSKGCRLHGSDLNADIISFSLNGNSISKIEILYEALPGIYKKYSIPRALLTRDFPSKEDYGSIFFEGFKFIVYADPLDTNKYKMCILGNFAPESLPLILAEVNA